MRHLRGKLTWECGKRKSSDTKLDLDTHSSGRLDSEGPFFNDWMEKRQPLWPAHQVSLKYYLWALRLACIGTVSSGIISPPLASNMTKVWMWNRGLNLSIKWAKASPSTWWFEHIRYTKKSLRPRLLQTLSLKMHSFSFAVLGLLAISLLAASKVLV